MSAELRYTGIWGGATASDVKQVTSWHFQCCNSLRATFVYFPAVQRGAGACNRWTYTCKCCECRNTTSAASLSGTKGNNTLYQELPAYRYFRLRNVVMSHDHHVKDSGHCIVQCSL